MKSFEETVSELEVWTTKTELRLYTDLCFLTLKVRLYDLRAQDIKTLTYPLYMTTGEFL